MTFDSDLKDGLRALADLVADAGRIVPFTGAGISTESGIPDFRSPGGFWTRNKPIDFEAYLRDPAMRRESWRRRFAMEAMFAGARPGLGHLALARWVAQGRSPAVITQNIDNLHQEAGVAAADVVELHGNTTYAICLSCGQRHELAWIRPIFERDGEPPACTTCGGILKTATISFGQAMPRAAMRRAAALAQDCDLFLVLGSSLAVQPAAGLPLVAQRSGARLAIVNRQPTPCDGLADVVIRGDVGPVLDELVHR